MQTGMDGGRWLADSNVQLFIMAAVIGVVIAVWHRRVTFRRYVQEIRELRRTLRTMMLQAHACDVVDELLREGLQYTEAGGCPCPKCQRMATWRARVRAELAKDDPTMLASEPPDSPPRPEFTPQDCWLVSWKGEPEQGLVEPMRGISDPPALVAWAHASAGPGLVRSYFAIIRKGADADEAACLISLGGLWPVSQLRQSSLYMEPVWVKSRSAAAELLQKKIVELTALTGQIQIGSIQQHVAR